MQMLLLQHVQAPPLTLALTGRIKPIARNGMHMVGVLGMLVIRVLCTTETNELVRGKVVVLTTPLLVLLSEMNLAVMELRAVLGQIILSLVLGLMSILVVLPLAVQ